jgi:ketosteroid isomerase-like protein
VSQENLEIVRKGLDRLSASYAEGAAAQELLDLCAPGIRVDASRRVFNPDTYEGRAGVQRSIRDTCDAWDSFHINNERFIDVGERVVVVQTIAGRGRASKAQVQLRGAMIWTVRDGAVQLIEVFVDPLDALKAVGLKE